MKRSAALAAVLAISAGCGRGQSERAPEAPAEELGEGAQKFSSDQATLLLFDFEGSLEVPGAVSASSARAYIDQQLLYTMGHLNEDRSVGRLDKVEVTQITAEPLAAGTRIAFHVRLPVGWGQKSAVPTRYAFTLPKVMGQAGLERFAEMYKTRCVDVGAHDVDSGSLWYYYRPLARGCTLAPEDVVVVNAAVSVSNENTTGKYPEYHRVWEDGSLRVVAIFGKYEDGATTSSDAGVAAFNAFLRRVSSELSRFALITTPAVLPPNPGVSVPDVTFEAVLSDGRGVKVTALLVDNVRTAGAAFDARYSELSTRADLIIYNGHAGLGSNVRALARKGQWVAGQYLTLFMNGCDTFAYVDGSLAQARARLNPDDPSGTKYLDIVTNAMPAYFQSMSSASIALIHGLTERDAPTTYEQMFAKVDRSQVVVVTGEEDNVYFPGYQPGFLRTERGSVAQDESAAYVTPTLPAGRYSIVLAHDGALPGGNADLAVRVGARPTDTEFDCLPARADSAETCEVTLAAPAALHAVVTGHATSASAYVLTFASLADAPAPWGGLDEKGSVQRSEERRYQSPLLPEGSYRVTLSGTGDADLYVRAGAPATLTDFDCRPYLNGSQESCLIRLTAPAELHLMVRGYAAGASDFQLAAEPE